MTYIIPIPDDEEQRLENLKEYDILDTAPELRDRLTPQFQRLRIESPTGASDEQLSSLLKSPKCFDNGQLFFTALFFSTYKISVSVVL